MDSLLLEKTKYNKMYNNFLLDNCEVNHISFDFRIKNNPDGILLLLLNFCVLEKLLNTSFTFHTQKKNIRSFAPIGSIIGGRFIIKDKYFLFNLLNFWLIRKNFFIDEKSNNEYSSISHFTLNNFLNFNFLKLNRSSWETFSYLYEKQIYGLDVTLSLPIRNKHYKRLILSSLNINYIY